MGGHGGGTLEARLIAHYEDEDGAAAGSFADGQEVSSVSLCSTARRCLILHNGIKGRYRYLTGVP